MQMSIGDCYKILREAKDPYRQLKILAELNICSVRSLMVEISKEIRKSERERCKAEIEWLSRENQRQRRKIEELQEKIKRNKPIKPRRHTNDTFDYTGLKIKAKMFRCINKVTQEQLANVLGVKRAYYSRFENDRIKTCNLEMREKLLKILEGEDSII